MALIDTTCYVCMHHMEVTKAIDVDIRINYYSVFQRGVYPIMVFLQYKLVTTSAQIYKSTYTGQYMYITTQQS